MLMRTMSAGVTRRTGPDPVGTLRRDRFLPVMVINMVRGKTAATSLPELRQWQPRPQLVVVRARPLPFRRLLRRGVMFGTSVPLPQCRETVHLDTARHFFSRSECFCFESLRRLVRGLRLVSRLSCRGPCPRGCWYIR